MNTLEYVYVVYQCRDGGNDTIYSIHKSEEKAKKMVEECNNKYPKATFYVDVEVLHDCMTNEEIVKRLKEVRDRISQGGLICSLDCEFGLRNYNREEIADFIRAMSRSSMTAGQKLDAKLYCIDQSIKHYENQT